MRLRATRPFVATVLVALHLFAAPFAHADGAATPSAIPGVKIIDAGQAKSMLDGRAAQFFDMRSPVNYGKGHIPGATGLAYRERSDKAAEFDASKDQFDLSKLPADKAVPIVFYSDGPTGWKSYKAAVLASRAGYTNIHYFRGGLAEWKSRGLPEAK